MAIHVSYILLFYMAIEDNIDCVSSNAQLSVSEPAPSEYEEGNNWYS